MERLFGTIARAHVILPTVLLLLLGSFCGYAAGYISANYVRRRSTLVTDIPGVKYYPNTTEASPMYYKILDIHSDHGDGGHIYIGGQNRLTELNQRDLSYMNKLEVTSSSDNIPTGFFPCETLQRDNTDYYCQFYVTFVQELNETTSILCGTNALYPRCNVFRTGVSSLNGTMSWDGIGLTASLPDQHTSTLAIKKEGDRLVVYAGAPTKREDQFAFSQMTFDSSGTKTSTVQTDTANSDWIESSSTSQPSFIGDPIQYNDKMYFFFREEAVEAKNVEKVVYSRVGQVCMNDEGGVGGALAGKWTTFLKARLSCSTQGNIKVYFDDLQSIYRSKANSNIIFGVFSTPSSSIPASAVCAYDLAEIEQLFAESQFKNQINSNSLWLNVASSEVPTPRPGTCAETMPTANYNDLASIQLMSSLVPNKANYTVPRTWSSSMESDYPIMVLLGHWLRHIVVQEGNPSGYDVFFFGTDEGQIFKAYMYMGIPRIIDEVLLTVNGGEQEAINALRISEDGTTLYASTSSRVYRLPAVNCGRFATCEECVRGLDPDCSWVTGDGEGCMASANGLRDLSSANYNICPASSSTTTSWTTSAMPASETTAESTQAWSPTSAGDGVTIPKQGQSHTGTGSPLASKGASSPTATHTAAPPTATTGNPTHPAPPTTTAHSSQPSPRLPNGTGYQTADPQPVCERSTASFNVWIVLFVPSLLFNIVEGGIIICTWWRKGKKRWTSPIKRKGRGTSQTVPLKAPHTSENDEDDDEADETVPMTKEGRNSTPHRETVVDETTPHGRKNGQTPSVVTPVKGSTLNESEA